MSKIYQTFYIIRKNIIILILIIGLIIINKKFLNHNLKICLCVIAKNENLYAREFVEHYKKIGYNNIFLYDNNEKNGEHFEDVINDYIKQAQNENNRPVLLTIQNSEAEHFVAVKLK